MRKNTSVLFDYRDRGESLGTNRSRTGRRRVRLPGAVIVTVLLVAAAGTAWHSGLLNFTRGERAGEPATVQAVAAPAPATIAAPAPDAVALTAMPDAGPPLESAAIVVRRNDTMDQIFRRLDLSLADLAEMRELPDLRAALDDLRPGDEIMVKHRDGALQQLVRALNESQTLEVTRDGAGFRTHMVENPVEVEIARERVRIDSSLFEAANAAGVSDITALAIATIFGWDIDFVLDIREGDEFTVIYEKVSQDGEYLRDGNVLAAEFVNAGQSYRAVRYQLPSGRADYFTPEGRSMHKEFLRAPLNFTRVSSRFNPRRRHPILNVIRAHQGVDYAAPSGTPVRAAGDGRVRFRGLRNGYGRAIELEHGGGITTLYGHMSRFAKSSAVGRHVEQGDVIGYVGMSGLATAPHLHYEYRVNGVHRNPQTVRLPEAKPIARELRADFAMHAAPLVAELELTKHAPQFAHR